MTVDKQHQEVHAECLQCGESWIGKRQLSEETGPRLSEALSVTKNKGSWEPRWDMLEARGQSTFRLLKKSGPKTSPVHKTIRKKREHYALH
jgi:hypothetical protein